MGRVSLAACLIFAASLAGAQTPEMVLGTDDGRYTLFTPQAVVEAGGGGTTNAYKLFAQETLAVTDITAQTTVAATGITQTWLAEKTFDQGLIVGPFFTNYEGTLSYDLGDTQGIRGFKTEIAVKHEFGDGKTLTTTRQHIRSTRKSSTSSTPLTSFSSVTDLQLGTVTADDGSTITITAALLAEPVKITVIATFTILNTSGDAFEAVLEDLTAQNAKVTFWQLERVTAGSGGGGGTTTPLSNATPKPLGTAAAGSSSAASRGDHVHLLPAQIATNKDDIASATAQGTTNRDNIQTNAGAITSLQSSVRTDVNTLETQIRNIRQVSLVGENPNGYVLTLDSTLDGADWGWAPSAVPTPLSDATPKPLDVNGGKAGTSKEASRGDHVHVRPFIPNGALVKPLDDVIGGAVGTSPSYARQDHQHPIQTRPWSTATPKANSEKGSAGTAGTISRGDHSHPGAIPVASTATPAIYSGAGVVGISVAYARGDHAHPHPRAADVLPSYTGHGDNCLKLNAAATHPVWAPCGGSGGGGGATFEELDTWDFSFTDALEFAATGVTIPATGSTWLLQSIGDQKEVRKQSASNTFTQSFLPQFWQRLLIADLLALPASTDGSDCVTSGLVRSDNADPPTTANSMETLTQIGNFRQVYLGRTTANELLACMSSAQAGTTYTGKMLFYVDKASGGGGGGGDDNPTIPKPTAGGALHYLRVNAAGAAYELATIDKYELPGPQASPVAADSPIPYNAGAVGHSLETGFDLDDVPDGPVYIRVLDPDHNNGVYSIWTTRATLMSLPAISGGSAASQVLQNHVILRNQSGQARGYFAGRITGTNDLWVSAPATNQAGGTLMFTAVSEAGWAEYAVARNKPAPFPGYGNVMPIKTGSSIQGSATTVARSDHQHAFPSTLYGSPVAVGAANADGTATTLARADHVHKDAVLSYGSPVAVGTANADGTATSVARSDHVHEDLAASPDTLLWTETRTSAVWGGGHQLGDLVGKAIYDGMTTAPRWRRLEVEIEYSTGDPALYEYAIGVIGLARDGSSAKGNNKVTLHGMARLGATLDIKIELPMGNDITTSTSTMTISGCSWCQSGTTFKVKLYGVR